jgi:hypothetical protein
MSFRGACYRAIKVTYNCGCTHINAMAGLVLRCVDVKVIIKHDLSQVGRVLIVNHHAGDRLLRKLLSLNAPTSHHRPGTRVLWSGGGTAAARAG